MACLAADGIVSVSRSRKTWCPSIDPERMEGLVGWAGHPTWNCPTVFDKLKTELDTEVVDSYERLPSTPVHHVPGTMLVELEKGCDSQAISATSINTQIVCELPLRFRQLFTVNRYVTAKIPYVVCTNRLSRFG